MVLTVLKGLGKAFIKSKAKKKTARELMDINEKSLQRVMDRGGYDPNVPHTKSFLHKYRKQTTKKILKQNKPGGKK